MIFFNRYGTGCKEEGIMDELMARHAFIVNGDSENPWPAADEFRDADREFQKSRRKAYRRMLFRAFGFGPAGATLLEMNAEGEFQIDLERIEGVDDGTGCLRPGVPPMAKSLLREWRKAFSRFAVGEETWIFALRSKGGLWYLEGGAPALLRLELMRMRGERGLRAMLRSLPDAYRGESPSEERCCGGDLGVA
jgi:hypothetical protein